MLEESARPGLTTPARIVCFRDEALHETVDELATEEPLEIRLAAGNEMHSVAVTMRTPGHDFELASGFLFSEGILDAPGAIAGISYCVDTAVDAQQRYNVVNVRLARQELPALERLERHFTTHSACGVCGKASIEALRVRAQPLEDTFRIPLARVVALTDKMQSAQRIFASTGGLHAAALFDENGELLVLREDIGRHNAVDKVLGWAFLQKRLPLCNCVLLVSGRASYELVQKSIAGRIPVLGAVSAPSSLAVELARNFNLTLLGFMRGSRANIYTGQGRLTETAG